MSSCRLTAVVPLLLVLAVCRSVVTAVVLFAAWVVCDKEPELLADKGGAVGGASGAGGGAGIDLPRFADRNATCDGSMLK